MGSKFAFRKQHTKYEKKPTLTALKLRIKIICSNTLREKDSLRSLQVMTSSPVIAISLKKLFNSQIEHHNSGRKKHSFDVMPSVIWPIQNNSERQRNDDIKNLPRADSGPQSPARPVQHSP